MDETVVSQMLEAKSNAATARKSGKHVQTLRGVRGTPQSEIARITDEIWREQQPALPHDEDALSDLFGSAWEDGLVAIGLLSALAPTHAADALDMGLDWLGRVDDIATADALGWLVLGPSALASGTALGPIYERAHRPEQRRAVLAMALAWLPVRIEGPSAAALRARMKTKAVRFVEEPQSKLVEQHLSRFIRDESPSVQKLIRRVLRSWANHDPHAVIAWAEGRDLPKMHRPEVKRAVQRSKRG
jgi:hypothetical protein